MKARRLAVYAPILMLSPILCLAQGDSPAISADTIQRLASVTRIDFSELEEEFQSGWFAANDRASEFILVDSSQRIHHVNTDYESEQLSFHDRRDGQVIAVLGAAFVRDKPYVMTSIDGEVFINQHPLAERDEFVAIFPGAAGTELIAEAMGDDGAPQFLRYQLPPDRDELTLAERIPLPAPSEDGPLMRIGRVSFPHVILSSLGDDALSVYSYPDRFSSSTAAEYLLQDGPAVFGALNGTAPSHFAWIDSRSANLNLLDLKTGENRAVAQLGGAYAQYLLLSHDASVILAVNLDFIPHVFAWNARSGEQFDLGPYRDCGRVPDAARLSRDGSSLIIGCDSGLDIWRIRE